MERFGRRLAFVHRLRAVLVAGVIALPGGATATSLASEVDSQDEGFSTQPDAPSDQVEGGSETETPLPVEVDPVVDPEEDGSPDLPSGGDPPAPIPLEVGAPEAGAPGGVTFGGESTPGPVTAPVVPQHPIPASPPAEAPRPHGLATGPGPKPLVVEVRPAGRHAHDLHLKARRHPVLGTGPAEEQRAVVELAAKTQPGTPPAAVPASQLVTRIAATARFHVVRPGESLWSIAAALLGPGASAATIAHRVDRLWKLNEDTIGTGDPDVLPAGVRLRLR